MNGSIWVVLAYYNFYSLIAYVLTLPLQMTPFQYGPPLSWNEILSNQVDSFKCFFGAGAQVADCDSGATTWVLIFTIGYIGSYGASSVLLKVKDSSLMANLQALMVPLTATILWLPFLVGANAESPVWWIIVALVLLTVVNLVYERYAKEDDNDVPKGPVGQLIVRSWLNYPVVKNGFQFPWENQEEDTVPLINN